MGNGTPTGAGPVGKVPGAREKVFDMQIFGRNEVGKYGKMR